MHFIFIVVSGFTMNRKRGHSFDLFIPRIKNQSPHLRAFFFDTTKHEF
jgi:hypothetical protein